PLVRSFMLIISTVSSRTGRETRRSAPTTGAGYCKTPVQASRLFTWHMTPACSDWQHPVPGLGQASSRARQENRAPDFWVSYSGGIAERFPALLQASEHVLRSIRTTSHLSNGRALLKQTGNDPPRPTDMALDHASELTSRISSPPEPRFLVLIPPSGLKNPMIARRPRSCRSRSPNARLTLPESSGFSPGWEWVCALRCWVATWLSIRPAASPRPARLWRLSRRRQQGLERPRQRTRRPPSC